MANPAAKADVLNAAAKAILNPPLYSNAARKSAAIASAELAPGNADRDATAASQAADPADHPIDASGDTFSLGAGGGGGGGTADVYVMPANASLHYRSMIIGDSSNAVFRQSSGVNQIAGDLTLGRQKNVSGTYQLSGGTLAAAANWSVSSATAVSSRPTASMSPRIPS